MTKTKFIGISTGIVVVTVFFAILMASGANDPTSPPQMPQQDSHHHDMSNNGNSQSRDAELDSMVDKSAPAFSLTDRDGKIYSSDTLRGKKVVLFFNEGLMCYPACWNQIASFPKDERFGEMNAEVLSVVVDPKEQWQKAVDKMSELAAATVVFDTNGTVSKKYGTLTTKSSMHYGTLPGHTYIILDSDGIVRYVFDDVTMGINNDKLIEKLKNIS